MTFVTLQVLSVQNDVHSASLVVITENDRIVIDAGEGCQRLLVEHKVRLGKLSNVLLTSSNPTSIGGLPGLMLTLMDAKASNLTIVGTKQVQKFCQFTSLFMKNISNYVKVIDEHDPVTKCVETKDINIFSCVLKTSNEYNSKVVYMGQTAHIPGKFDVERAIQLGVPKGPMFGQLKAGKSVTIRKPSAQVVIDGVSTNNVEEEETITIHSEEVVFPSERSRYFIVIPALELIDNSLGDDEILHQLVDGDILTRFDTGGNPYDWIIHLSNLTTIEHPRYQQLITKLNTIHHYHTSSTKKKESNKKTPEVADSLMSSSISHLYLGRDTISLNHSIIHHGMHAGGSSFKSSMRYTKRLHSLLPTIFQQNIIPVNDNKITNVNDTTTEDVQIIHQVADPLMKIHIAPMKKRSIDYYQPDNNNSNDNDNDNDDDVINTKIIELQKKYQLQQLGGEVDHLQSQYRLTFLGTGCAIPSKYRNVSAILLQKVNQNTNESTGILLDCGEGTWHQMMSIEPPATSNINDTTIKNHRERYYANLIKVIIISHPHADHHLGILNVLLQRYRILKSLDKVEPILLIASTSVIAFVNRITTQLYPWLLGSYRTTLINTFDARYLLEINHQKKRINYQGVDENELDIDNENITPINPMNKRARRSEVTSDEYDKVSEVIAIADSDSNNSNNSNYSNNSNSSHQDSTRYPRTFFNIADAGGELCTRLLKGVGVIDLFVIPAIHCWESFSLLMTVEDDASKLTRIAYSGDTRPNENFIKLVDSLESSSSSEGSMSTIDGIDVLIHEATFEDEMLDEAISKKHATIGEALRIGQRMRARAIILTHFSQRYHGVPRQIYEIVQQQHQSANDDTMRIPLPLIAFDYMSIAIHDLNQSGKITSALAELFPPEELSEANNNDEIIEELK